MRGERDLANMAQNTTADPGHIQDSAEVAPGTPASGRSTDGPNGALIPWPAQHSGGEPRRQPGASAGARSEPAGAVAGRPAMTPSSADRARYREAILERLDFTKVFAGIRNQKPSGDGCIQGLCPFHDDHHPSLGVNLKTGTWECFVGCGKGDVFAYLMRRSGRSFKEVLYDLGDNLGLERPTATTLNTRTAVYQYRDEHGTLLYEVLRKPGKKFSQRRPDGQGGWTWDLKGVRRVLYRLPEVLSRLNETVYIVEGEKDVDRLVNLGLLATTNSCGSAPWLAAYSEVLRDRDVVVLPDNDAPGQKRAEEIAQSLAGIAASVKVVPLPGVPETGDISDWLDAGHDVGELHALVASTKPVHADADPMVKNVRPVIIINNRQSIEVIRNIWTATHAANDPPELFLSSGQLVRLSPAADRPIIQPLDEHSAFGHLMRVASWYREGKNGLVDADPKKTFARDILANPDPYLPPLDAIITAPVFDAECRLLNESGYHRDARLWLHLDVDMQEIAVPDRPTAADLEVARSLLCDDLLVDFPFTADSDRAHTVAALMQPFVRPMIGGSTPLYLIEAPLPGSGKGLLADLITYPCMGEAVGSTTVTRDENETRKKITSLLRRGHPVILIDNLDGGLSSSQLASAITATRWEDRALGTNNMVSLPNRALLLASGNNPALSQEIARRSIRIRLSPEEEQPWKRTVFKHPAIREWALQNRRELVRAILTIIRSWMWAGRPEGQQVLGSFESWSRIVGGIVGHLGLPGFLSDADEFYTAADSETGEWSALVAAWWEQHKGSPVGAGVLLELAKANELVSFAYVGQSDPSQRARFGKALNDLRGRKFDGLEVVITQDAHAKKRQYVLRPTTSELFQAGDEVT